jgi:hypothetical protein
MLAGHPQLNQKLSVPEASSFPSTSILTLYVLEVRRAEVISNMNDD